MLCVNSWPVYSYILITSRSLVAWTVLNLPRDSTVTRRTAVHVLQFFLPHECRPSGFFSRAVWVWQDSNPTWHFWIGQMQRPCCRKPGTTRLLERPNAYSTWTRVGNLQKRCKSSLYKLAMSVRWLLANALLRPKPVQASIFLWVRAGDLTCGLARHQGLHYSGPCWSAGSIIVLCSAVFDGFAKAATSPPARGSNCLAELVCLNHYYTRVLLRPSRTLLHCRIKPALPTSTWWSHTASTRTITNALASCWHPKLAQVKFDTVKMSSIDDSGAAGQIRSHDRSDRSSSKYPDMYPEYPGCRSDIQTHVQSIRTYTRNIQDADRMSEHMFGVSGMSIVDSQIWHAPRPTGQACRVRVDLDFVLRNLCCLKVISIDSIISTLLFISKP